MVWRIIVNFAVFVNFVFRNSRNLGQGLPATLWINYIDFVSGLANYRKFRNFRNSRNFRWDFPVTLWINFVDIVSGVANYRKFRSFRNCVQSWTLLGTCWQLLLKDRVAWPKTCMHSVVLINWFHNKKSLTIFELGGVSFGLLVFLDFGVEETSVTCTSSSSSPCFYTQSPTKNRHTSVTELPLLLGDLFSITHSYWFFWGTNNNYQLKLERVRRI